MTQMPWHRASLTASRSLLWRDDSAAWEDPSCVACLAQLVSLGAQACADLCTLALPPLSLLVQTGPTITPKCCERSALSEDHSLVKAGVLSMNQLGVLTIILQICRIKPDASYVDSYKPKYLFSNWSKRPSCKEKIYLHWQGTFFLQS